MRLHPFPADTALVMPRARINGQVGDTAAYDAPEGYSNANVAWRDAMLPAAAPMPDGFKAGRSSIRLSCRMTLSKLS